MVGVSMLVGLFCYKKKVKILSCDCLNGKSVQTNAPPEQQRLSKDYEGEVGVELENSEVPFLKDLDLTSSGSGSGESESFHTNYRFDAFDCST